MILRTDKWPEMIPRALYVLSPLILTKISSSLGEQPQSDLDSSQSHREVVDTEMELEEL